MQTLGDKKANKEDWKAYAAAALAAQNIKGESTARLAVDIAAEAADRMLHQQQSRFS